MTNATQGKSKIRYFLGKLDVQHGEYCFTETFIFTLDNPRKNPTTFLNRLASDWYGGKPKKVFGWYHYNGGEIAVQPGAAYEISEGAYKELQHTLADMSNY